ncbi:MAG: methyltransferase domain-containing protein [Candidatus Eisenbacteria bacterium]|nr:methyltransferase domain-containing protein [Candidatus Eisenbacteria bacterium]
MTLAEDVARYYAARAPVYDETAGYTDAQAERLREPIQARYRTLFTGHTVLEIACGTGYWTRAIAPAARAVLGIDIHAELLAQARRRCASLPHVAFEVADAYELASIPGGFSAALGIWWWSHVPRERLPAFLDTLHGKLRPGARVLFADQLPYEGHRRRQDPRGNTLEERRLPDGRRFWIVKNFPTEAQIRAALARSAEEIEYRERPDERSWSVRYRLRAAAANRAGRRCVARAAPPRREDESCKPAGP